MELELAPWNIILWECIMPQPHRRVAQTLLCVRALRPTKCNFNGLFGRNVVVGTALLDYDY